MEKQEIVEQLSQIQTSLNEQKFLPYRYETLNIFGLMVIISGLLFEPLLEMNTLYVLYMIVINVVIGLALSIYFTNKESLKYDMEYSLVQKFADRHYGLASLLGIVLSYIFIKEGDITYIFPLWLFLIGFAYHAIAYVTNNQIIAKISHFDIASGFVLMLVAIFFPIEILNSGVKYLSLLFISGSFFYLAYMSKKQKNV